MVRYAACPIYASNTEGSKTAEKPICNSIVKITFTTEMNNKKQKEEKKKKRENNLLRYLYGSEIEVA